MNAMKFSEGQKVTITKSVWGHGFAIGTVVTIGLTRGDQYQAFSEGSMWWISDEEAEEFLSNIFGNANDLELFGASGELRYCYCNNDEETVETYYNEFGKQEKRTTVKK